MLKISKPSLNTKPIRNSAPFQMAREGQALALASFKAGFRWPLRVSSALVKEGSAKALIRQDLYLDAFGEALMDTFDELGPLYGKAGQVLLGRLPSSLAAPAQRWRLTRLFGQWQALPFSEIESVLDQELPLWRDELRLEEKPLGVASMAQVHGATDKEGGRWVVKILKPLAKQRLGESLAAIEALSRSAAPLAQTRASERALRELEDLVGGFRRELSLGLERENLLKAHGKFRARGRPEVLRLPLVHDRLHSDNVLVVERFDGVPLSDVVAGKIALTEEQKQSLARGMVGEMLVQVFEWGLFHADPHAGNLILCPDGTLGLFDWGLAGELTETDRKHISALLKAVVTADIERLCEALVDMGTDQGLELERSDVMNELRQVARQITGSQAKTEVHKQGINGHFQSCLEAADRLGITPPHGLLLMAKSILTIEALGRGLDPQLPLLRIAGPILLRAAKPSLGDWFRLLSRAPSMGRKLWKSGT